MMRPVSFIARETRNNLHGINAILGSLEKYADPDLCHTHYSDQIDEIIRLAENAHRDGRLSVIAWSFHSPEANRVQNDLNIIKQRLSQIDVRYIAGGAHASACPESTLKNGFDYVICGEGEQLIIDLISGLISDENKIFSNRIIRSPEQQYIELDLYPAIPERSLKLNPVEITRGCLYGCAFCQTSYLFGKTFRHRSEKKIIEAVKLLMNRGGHFLRMTTPSALSYGSADRQPRLERVESLLKNLRDVMGPERKIYYGSFPSEIRPEHITKESMTLLRRFVDNDNIIIGVQSGSEKLLRLCGRETNPDQSVQAVETAIACGFSVNTDIIFGLPGEDSDDRTATIRLIHRLIKAGARIHAHWFMPIPGTPLEKKLSMEPDISLLKELNRFMAEGKVYGEWRKQMKNN